MNRIGPRGCRALFAAIGLLTSVCVLAPSASAQQPAPTSAQTSVQAWPQRPVRFILPFGAGTATDVAARLMSEKLSARWGQPIVVENRPGADGLLAINAFISANDDHVLLYASTASFMAHPYTLEKMPYNLERDFAPIARITDTVLAASVPSSLKANSLKEFVALAKAQPGKLNAAGAAGVPDFTLGYFLKLENLDVTRVPYKDVVQAATDLSRRADPVPAVILCRRARRGGIGRIRILAINVRERASFAPDIPTIHEAGLPVAQRGNHRRILRSARDGAGAARAHRQGRARGGGRARDHQAAGRHRTDGAHRRPRGTRRRRCEEQAAQAATVAKTLRAQDRQVSADLPQL